MRARLLEEARSADLADSVVVRQLGFLQRLLAGLATQIEDHEMPELLDEAHALGLEDTDGVRLLQRHQRLTMLRAQRPQPVGRDERGRGVYLECEAEYKNKPGIIRVHDDGMTFTSEVFIEIAWNNVIHVAKTTHTYQGFDCAAIAIQEGKRRTPTKFVFADRDSEYACEVIARVWNRSQGAQLA